MDLPDKTEKVGGRVPKQGVIPKGSAVPTERPARRRFMDHVFAESPKTILGLVYKNVVEPHIKQGVYSAGEAFLKGMLFGGQGAAGGTGFGIVQGTVLRGGGVVMPTDYNALSSNPQIQAAAAAGNLSGPYKDLKLANDEIAQRLLAEMYSNLNQYRVTTVADLYEAAELTPAPHHANYGWYALDGARIVREAGGVVLQLPKPVRV